MARNDILEGNHYKEDWLNGLKIFECVSFLFLCIFITFYMRILLRRHFCNKNLLILLVAQPTFHVFGLFTRIVRHGLNWNGLLTQSSVDYINFWSDMCVTVSFQTVLGYSIERFIAMRYVCDYDERFRGGRLAVIILSGACTYSVILIYIWSHFWISNPLAYSCQYTLFASACLIFVALRQYSLRVYKKVAAKHEATVAERFKTARNLKAATLLIYLAPYKCLTNFASLYAYHWIWEEHEPFYFDFYAVFYFFSGHIQMILTISGHNCLIEEFYKTFGYKRNEDPKTVTTVTGRKMIFNKEEEPDLYMKQLASSWDAVHDRRTSSRVKKRIEKYTASVSPA